MTRVKCNNVKCIYNLKTSICCRPEITIDYQEYVDDDHLGISIDKIFKCLNFKEK